MANGRITWKEPAIVLGVIGLIMTVLAFTRDLTNFTVSGDDRTSNSHRSSIGPAPSPSFSGGPAGGSSVPTPTTSKSKTPPPAPNKPTTESADPSGGQQIEVPNVVVAVNPKISLSPIEGQANTTLTITGRGFTPNGDVEVTFHTQVIAKGTAGKDGNFRFTARVPSSYGVFAPQSFTVRASDAATLQSDTAEFALVL